MDVVWLSRIQFAFTVSFHYLFPPLSIGLALMIAIMEGIAAKDGDTFAPDALLSLRESFAQYYNAQITSSEGDVIRVIDGPLALSPCASRTAYRRCEDCTDETTCAIRKSLIDVRNSTARILEQHSLADALADLRRRTLEARLDPRHVELGRGEQSAQLVVQLAREARSGKPGSAEPAIRAAGVHSVLNASGSISALVQDALLPLLNMQPQPTPTELETFQAGDQLIRGPTGARPTIRTRPRAGC